MNEILIYTVAILVGLGLIAAVILYFVAQKFKVFEDPRIDQVEEMLPAANCGGCGYPGCRGMADALVKRDDISALYCPVGGSATMQAVAEFLGKAVAEKEPTVAVVRCNGSFCNRPRTNQFDGAASCAVISSLYAGETGCAWGCLGKGDCTLACNFDALFMNPETGLPEMIEEKCTACGACVKKCPKMIIELRKRGPKGRRVYVDCVNKDKGAVTRKACSVGCIGCGKCVKICPFEAITLENNLAYIDPEKCRLCRKCVPECPTSAITEVNFPPRPASKPKEDAPVAKPKVKPAAEPTTEYQTLPVEDQTRQTEVIRDTPVDGARAEYVASQSHADPVDAKIVVETKSEVSSASEKNEGGENNG